MAKGKITVYADVDMEELAVGLTSENNYEDIYTLIRRIDAHQQDWNFTRGLKRLAEELMAEDVDMKIDSAVY